MSTLSPAAALSAQLDAEWTDAKHLAVAADEHSYPGERVLIGIRRQHTSCVISVAASEYDGLSLARLIGFEEAKPDPLATAIEAKAKAKTHDRIRKS